MMPLYDMMMNAQNGDAVRAMAKQFGLNESQMEQAMAALMPAFSTGLKRNAANPMDMSNFLSALASGQHAAYFENMQAAFTPQGREEGNGILGHIFGSKEVSRAVAAQAEAATGIGQEIFKQMLPVLATTIMGGLFKQATGQATGQSAGQRQAGAMAGSNPIGDLITEMMRQGMGGAQAKPAPRASPMDNPLGQILEGMFGGGQRRQPQPGASNPFGDNPLGQIFQDMLGGGQTRQAPEPEQQPDRMPSGRARNPYDDLFGKMFDSGREVQKGYQKNMESIFDQYLQGMNRK
ncbi:MAG: DUF937 domain-containing protein [Hoeflea sp.]|uniref:DUF937 domain-containing protein n=1 Tax=Hoeflea sp. TaxID=1940281 RepID=UPI001D21D8AC|nr:DUF937 domain-containing protein [Hoeflea sp.]MBU4529160.1 DUF937 domain-containing protein [Alphaproteobacteria bacterium]MBU4543565.1 DUF937 domain-containing protein [Alphaproteobacteria bacterium]MBU4549190.1 DUF937 domain-containing protein [Alphaproteobacteria bacterium]MBV1725325.1 DUF937 domain-containing protein [Hoeflea sp.]MBV1785286.1 DUF937 domain-containing protein [Hoeflea sp.]